MRYCYDPHGDRVVEFSDSEDDWRLAGGEEQEGMIVFIIRNYVERSEPTKTLQDGVLIGMVMIMIENIVSIFEQLLMVGQLRIAHGATRIIFLIVIPKNIQASTNKRAFGVARSQ